MKTPTSRAPCRMTPGSRCTFVRIAGFGGDDVKSGAEFGAQVRMTYEIFEHFYVRRGVFVRVAREEAPRRGPQRGGGGRHGGGGGGGFFLDEDEIRFSLHLVTLGVGWRFEITDRILDGLGVYVELRAGGTSPRRR